MRGVTTSDGTIAAPVVVNAAGPAAARVGRLAGLTLPVYPRSAPHLLHGAVPGDPRARADHDRHRGAGSTSARRCSSPPEPRRRPGHRRRPGRARRLEHDGGGGHEGGPPGARCIERARIAGGWAGLRPLTPDDHAIIGWAPGVEGFFLAVGWGGHGFQHSARDRPPGRRVDRRRPAVHGSVALRPGPLRRPGALAAGRGARLEGSGRGVSGQLTPRPEPSSRLLARQRGRPAAEAGRDRRARDPWTAGRRDPLGDEAARRGRVLEAVPAPADGQEEALDARRPADDRVVVGCEGAEPCPPSGDARPLDHRTRWTAFVTASSIMLQSTGAAWSSPMSWTSPGLRRSCCISLRK